MSEINLDAEMVNFRKFILIVGILTIVTFVPYAGLAAIILLFISITIIRRINNQFKSPYLEEFRSKLIPALVLWIIANIFQSIFTSGIQYLGWFALIPFGISTVLIIIAGAFEMNAYANLKTFFEQNTDAFRDHDVGDLIEGSDKLRTAGLMHVLNFLIVPLFIGWIFQIIGFFTMGTLKTPEQRKQTMSQKPEPTPKEVAEPTPEPVEEVPTPEGSKFCPNCGAEVKGEGNFCSECGSSIN